MEFPYIRVSLSHTPFSIHLGGTSLKATQLPFVSRDLPYFLGYWRPHKAHELRQGARVGLDLPRTSNVVPFG